MSAADSMCPLPLDCSQTYGALTLAGWSMHTGAWCVFDLSPLLETPAFRGDNVLVESAAGRSARRVVVDETDYSLPMMFSGAVDREGTPWAVPRGGIEANRRAFTDQLIEPIRGTSVVDVPGILTIPDASDPEESTDYEFRAQPLRLDWNLLPNGYARAVLSLRIPVPVFVEVVD